MVSLVTKRDGSKQAVNLDKINKAVTYACEGIEDVSPSAVILGSKVSLYEEIPTKEIDRAMIYSARTLIETEPNYTYVASRLLLNAIYKEVFGISTNKENFDILYRNLFIEGLEQLVKQKIFSPELLTFDLEELAEALVPERDRNFKYMGLQTVYDKYLKRDRDKQVRETPQAFYMRVAMGQALLEPEPFRTKFTLDLYHSMSTFKFSPSTPTLFNSGCVHSQLSSCYLSTVGDSSDDIMGEFANQANLSKYAGGLGVDITSIRAAGAPIQKTNGTSSGTIPYAVIFNYILIAFNQAGARPGSGCLYMQPWHKDIMDFLQLRVQTGDHERRAARTSTAVWMNDLLMEYKETDKDWYLFCPKECPKLLTSYGAEFTKHYENYVSLAKQGKIKNFSVVSSKTLMKEIYKRACETGHPFVTFKDTSNIQYANKHVGIVNSSNLCTEIIEHTKASTWNRGQRIHTGETAVCTLNSPNLMAFIKDEEGTLDYDALDECLRIQVRALDNNIDNNFYPTDEAEKSAKSNRQLGIGCMGVQEYLQFIGVPYDSDEAVEICAKIQEFISRSVINASIDLARERGVYPNYEGSNWSKGILPQDAYIENHNYRFPDNPITDVKSYWEWTKVRTKLEKYGIRNGNLLAIAPTACVTTDTLLLTDKGYIRIGNLVEDKNNEWTDINVNVVQEKQITRATKFFVNGVKETYEVTTQSGRTITCTPTHRLKVLDKGNCLWRRVDELEKDDCLVLQLGGLHKINTSPDNNFEQIDEFIDYMNAHNVYSIPSEILSSNIESIRKFIYRLFELNSSLKNSYRTLSKGNKKFIQELKILLEGIGIYAFIEQDVLHIKEIDYKNKLYSKLQCIFFDKVVDVRKAGSKLTVDIHVPDLNKYIANNIVSHNTISYIVGCSQSIEPEYTLMYAYQVLSGKFTMLNHLFVKDMKKLGLWCESLHKALKINDGDISNIEGIPQKYKDIYKTAFNRDFFKLIDCASRRQIWIDQAQSFNIYYSGKSLKAVDSIYTYAWKKLLKTTYYLRAVAASTIEKSTVENKVVPPVEPSSCSIEAMKRGEVCESCQ